MERGYEDLGSEFWFRTGKIREMDGGESHTAM